MPLSSKTTPLTFSVDAPNLEGLRLDRFLVVCMPDVSRSLLQQWLEKGCISRNNEVIHKASTKLKMGDEINVSPPEAEDSYIKPQEIPIDILFEDDDLLVINKAAGQVVHPAPGHKDDTLVNALLSHCKDNLSGIGGIKRPGIVHRLDKDTSGLMVVAKNDFAHQGLSDQFHPSEDGSFKTLSRRYKALVFGKMPKRQMALEGFIGRHPRNRQKMALVPEVHGKKAITHLTSDHTWVIDGVKSPISLIDCHLQTGRTHQIRVHCLSIQCYLIGDSVYGKPSLHNQKGLPDVIANFERQALHAYELTFIHPRSLEKMTFTSPLPCDMQEIVDTLKESSPL